MFVYSKKPTGNLNVPSVTGSQVSSQPSIITWQPSTWPAAPKQFNSAFHATLKKIFQETMLDELRGVVTDIQNANASSTHPLEHRGHVIAVAYMCALDAVASYAYKNKHVAKFVRNHFPVDYRPHARRIYPEYRLSLVHAWNLFGDVALSPGNERIEVSNGWLRFGLLNFMAAFESGVADFLDKLERDRKLQERALFRYREVTGEVSPSWKQRDGRRFVAGTIVFVTGLAAGLVIGMLRRGR